ncbi:RNA polymerase II transcription factor B subunit 2 AltName: Full=RNA polymerase II transcription factor B 52 kDa subunit; AltName: Full=RNA polymerase II transcription factor B p52 subunit [Serendipita indica DSM 11827]|nr:RNA polymerase II transcription factor B subunit 2 AltName: Full=RNA polymerase II transcription factor B 52 kDa subunit; AltName: Full=RNA polymerase II transcription factor B p52 subunit [Serendipita indica DSM 11827]
MSLLWLEGPVETQSITNWITLEGRSAYEHALKSLAKLQILPNSKEQILLQASFKSGLRNGLTGSGQVASFGALVEPDNDMGTLPTEMLDNYAVERWDTILHFMVTSGTEQASARPSEGVLYLLEHSGLMSNEHGRRIITSAGFQFLLQSPHAQLWEFILSYLRMMAEREDMDMVDILGFFFMLSMTQPGQHYSTHTLSPTQLIMVSDLRDFGLVYFPSDTTTSFQPTRFATTLTSYTSSFSDHDLTIENGADLSQEFVVLETNYHVYAYTNNPLQIAVLNLFVSFKARFPNMIMGSLTRDSVKKALVNGITADQILSYLVTHAHPQMRKNNPIIPVTVQDQIRLWELERHRVKGQDGYLYKEFASMNDYEVVVQYARELGVVLWENASRRMFFADAAGRVHIRSYIERRTAL